MEMAKYSIDTGDRLASREMLSSLTTSRSSNL